MEQELFLPTLPHWTYENPWSGSYQKVRYFIKVSDGAMHADVWDQDISLEFADIKAHSDFELTQEGLDAMRAWLIEQIDALNGAE